MSATYSTEEFIKSAGRFGGVHTEKESGEKYFVETGTGRHIERRFGIPVETSSAKGKVSRKLVGTFNTIAGALAWAIANSPQAHHEIIRHSLCDYYGQPRELQPGPTTSMLKADPECDARYKDDENIPGVMIAADYKPRKRKAADAKAPKAPKKVKPKPNPVIKGTRGVVLIKTSKNPEKAVMPLEGSIDLLKARERLARRGSQLTEVTENGVTFLFQSAPNEGNKLKVNPWAGANNVMGDFIVMASKKFKLTFSE